MNTLIKKLVDWLRNIIRSIGFQSSAREGPYYPVIFGVVFENFEIVNFHLGKYSRVVFLHIQKRGQYVFLFELHHDVLQRLESTARQTRTFRMKLIHDPRSEHKIQIVVN